MFKRVWNKVKAWFGPASSGSDDFHRTCPDTILFDTDSAEITAKAASELDLQIAWLKRNTNYGILIEGHCDSTGTREYNLALGERRAMAAKRYIETHMDTRGREVQTVSYGKERPMTYEHNDQERAFNRRAVTVLR